jgi:hypothetical protein
MTAEPDIQPAPRAGGGADDASPVSVTSGNYAGLLAITAMGSGLLLGVLLAASFGIGSDLRAGGGSLFAQGELAQALTDQMSGNRGIGPSFWSKDGVFCRVFDTRKARQPGLDGIACREGAGWRVRIVTTSTGASAMPETVRSTMGNLIVGRPLDTAAERQARHQGWRPD